MNRKSTYRVVFPAIALLFLASGALGAGEAGTEAASAATAGAEQAARAGRPKTLVATAESVSVPDTDVFTLYSEAVGETFEISVAYPKSYRSGERAYPVVYILDANLIFATAAQVAHTLTIDTATGVPELLLVGIGYPLAEETWFREVARLRMRDFTPPGFKMFAPPPTIEIPGGAANAGAPPPANGAPKFLAFIENELDPQIRGAFRTQDDSTGILGISGGGLFTLYAFSRRSRLFNRYWIGSTGFPEQDDPTFLRFTEAIRQAPARETRLFISIGQEELEAPPGPFDFIARTYRDLERLSQQPLPDNLSVVTQVFADENHGSVVPASLTRAFRVLYRD